jgi:hypothetical protein
VGGRQRREPALTLAGQRQADDPLILGVGEALDEAEALGAIDELDHAVVAQEEVVGDVADRRRSAMTSNRQEQLVLRPREADGLRLVLAPVEEPAEPVAEGQEALEVVIGEASSSSTTHIGSRYTS